MKSETFKTSSCESVILVIPQIEELKETCTTSTRKY